MQRWKNNIGVWRFLNVILDKTKTGLLKNQFPRTKKEKIYFSFTEIPEILLKIGYKQGFSVNLSKKSSLVHKKRVAIPVFLLFIRLVCGFSVNRIYFSYSAIVAAIFPFTISAISAVFIWLYASYSIGGRICT